MKSPLTANNVFDRQDELAANQKELYDKLVLVSNSLATIIQDVANVGSDITQLESTLEADIQQVLDAVNSLGVDLADVASNITDIKEDVHTIKTVTLVNMATSIANIITTLATVLSAINGLAGQLNNSGKNTVEI